MANGGMFGGLGWEPAGWSANAYDDPVEGGSPAGPPVQAGEVVPTGVPDVDAGLGLPPSRVFGELAGIKRREIVDREKTQNLFDQRLEQDRARAQRALDATAIGPDELQPWDQDKQREKYRTDPLESFGSLGSVFAMIASAFTGAPMENALNGAAAAMTAIKAGNEKEFDRAYDAWQKNNHLAIQRHTLQQQDYNNAIQLMNTDMAAGRVKLQMLAAKYGDQKTLFLLENGYDKEVIELQEQRNKAATSGEQAMRELTKERIQREMLQRDPNFNNDDPNPYLSAAKKLESFNRIYGIKQTPEQEIMGKWFYENPQGTAQQAAEFYSRLKAAQLRGSMNPEWQFMQQRVPELMKSVEEGGQGLSYTDAALRAEQEWRAARQAPAKAGTEAEFITKRRQELIATGMSETEAQKQALEEYREAGRAKPVLTQGRQVAQEIERRRAQYVRDGLDEKEAFAKASREVRKESQVITANRASQLQARVDAIHYSRGVMDNAETLMNKHWGITGIGGMITRPMETVANITGISNKSDVRQFERYINELQEWAPSVLLDRSGRPLSSEASRMNAVIAGLRAGDTTANTKRAFAEMRKLWDIIQKQVMSQIEGDWAPASGPGSKTPAGGGGKWWDKVPDKRSEVPGRMLAFAAPLDSGIRTEMLPENTTAEDLRRREREIERHQRHPDAGASELYFEQLREGEFPDELGAWKHPGSMGPWRSERAV